MVSGPCGRTATRASGPRFSSSAATVALMDDASLAEWGWRIPFLFSVVLLAISLWMRLKLSESPVFQKMRAAGEQVANPIKESFTYPGNLKRMIVALFGIAAGLTVIWYTAMFTVLSFLQTTMRVEETTAQVITGVGVAAGVGWFLLFGHVSDRIGRKKPIVAGYVLTLVLLFPIFWLMGAAANPGLARAADTQPVVVHGPTCSYSPFDKVQATPCGKLLDHLSKKGVPYSVTAAPDTYVAVGSGDVTVTTPQELDAALTRAGYDLTPVRPSPGNIALILVAILAMSMLSGITYGPVAALLAEMFPPAIRYSSLSIPYHLGTGYFGGFLPFISQYIVAKTGDPYAGLWYTFAVVVMALLVTLFFGRWHGPFGILPQLSFVWFALKTAFFIMLFILLRASIPRPRYDQVMDFSWRFCLPLTLINLLVTAAVVLLNTPAAAVQ